MGTKIVFRIARHWHTFHMVVSWPSYYGPIRRSSLIDIKPFQFAYMGRSLLVAAAI